MSSLFSRRGTTGYRWPKVCVSPKPPPQPPPPPATMIAATLYADITINDPTFPTHNMHVMRFPQPFTGPGAFYDATPGPAGATNMNTRINTGTGGDSAISIAPGQVTTDNGVLPTFTLGAPYDSGTITLFNSLHQNVGTIRLYT